MNAKHWLLVAYVLAVTTVVLFKQQRLEHPKTPAELALDARLDEAKRLHDSVSAADKRTTYDQYCATDFLVARSLADTVQIIRGHGAIWGGRSGACYIDAHHKPRWRP